MDILQYTFFQYAIIGSILASIACSLIGTYIVTRRLVFISGGITHASFGGIGLGIFFNISPIFSAALFSVFSACGIEWLGRRSDMREDSAIAIFWTFGMAVGIIFSFLSSAFSPDLSTYLFGNILTITLSDIYFLLAVTIISAIVFGLFLHPIICMAFDREFARSQNIPVSFFEYLLMILTALTIVACLRMIGIVLAISMLTIPPITANLFTYRFKSIIGLSIIFSCISCISGLILSYFFNIPSGASIIFVSIFVYIICKLLTKYIISQSWK